MVNEEYKNAKHYGWNQEDTEQIDVSHMWSMAGGYVVRYITQNNAVDFSHGGGVIMAIEAISSNVVTQQMPKVEKTAPVERVEVTNQQPAQTQEFRPVVETQGSENQNGRNKDKNRDGKEDGKNIQDVSPDKVKSAIADINKKIAPTRTQCEFKYHEETHRISITVRDTDTDKVIKEIPPEKTLDMIAKTLELAGILVDEKR